MRPPEHDQTDYDGMGNWGRFPAETPVTPQQPTWRLWFKITLLMISVVVVWLLNR